VQIQEISHFIQVFSV
jgi:folate-binding protein YgfZ